MVVSSPVVPSAAIDGPVPNLVRYADRAVVGSSKNMIRSSTEAGRYVDAPAIPPKRPYRRTCASDSANAAAAGGALCASPSSFEQPHEDEVLLTVRSSRPTL